MFPKKGVESITVVKIAVIMLAILLLVTFLWKISALGKLVSP